MFWSGRVLLFLLIYTSIVAVVSCDRHDLYNYSENPSYTVTYSVNNATSGTAPEDPAIYYSGDIVQVAGNPGNLVIIPPAGTGEAFKFGGWNTQPDGNGIHYEAGADTFIVKNDTFLYAEWIPYALRDTGPAGGLIFHDKGTYSAGWRYLEAAPQSTEWTGKQWGADGTTIAGLGSVIGTGKANTDIISAWLIANSEPDRAAQLCDELTHNAFDDWFLPSSEEMKEMCWNLQGKTWIGGTGEVANPDVTAPVGGFTAANYWSSTQSNATNSSAQSFSNGSTTGNAKTTPMRVRAARAF